MKLVLHRLDGSLLKGSTTDFAPGRQTLHVKDQDTGQMTLVDTTELKAIFFVNSFEGNQHHIERTDVERTGFGKKIKVHFKDGETIFGYTTSYSAGRPSFFVFPADPESNNQRVFVLDHSTNQIDFT